MPKRHRLPPETIANIARAARSMCGSLDEAMARAARNLERAKTRNKPAAMDRYGRILRYMESHRTELH